MFFNMIIIIKNNRFIQKCKQIGQKNVLAYLVYIIKKNMNEKVILKYYINIII